MVILCAEPRVESIINQVADICGVESYLLRGRCRLGQVSLARQISMYIMRMKTPLSLNDIGYHLGGRRPATISHGIQNIHTLTRANKGLRDLVNNLLNKQEDGLLCG